MTFTYSSHELSPSRSLRFSELNKRKEFFKIKGWTRKYDAESGKFIANISYETAAPKPTQRVVAVAESFGLGLDK